VGNRLSPANDVRMNQQLAQRFGRLDQYEIYADYANPFAELLQGLYFLYHQADTGDAERARKSLERTAGMAPYNPAVADDLNAALDTQAGRTPPPTAHVFFATGTSPRLEAFYLELPIFLVSRQVDYIAANFPFLVENPHHLDHCVVTAGPGHAQATSQPLANLDAVVGQEFKNRLPMLVVKSTLSAALKATAAYALNRSLRESSGSSSRRYSSSDQFAILAGRLASIGYQAATNQADQRIWASLPKKIDYARLPLPAAGQLQVQAGGTQTTLTLDPTRSHGVWVRSVAPSRPLMIHTFPLGSAHAPQAAPHRGPRP